MGGGWWYSVSPSPSPFPLNFGFRIWDLDLGIGFGTWIWDLDLGLDLGLTTRLGKTRSSTNPIFCPIFLQIIPPHHPLLGLLLRGLGGLERSVDLSVDGAHCHCTP